MSDDQAEWVRRQRHAAAAQAARDDQRRAGESAKARRLVADLVRAATERELWSERLVARAYSGRATYRTDVHGWYVRRDRSLAVGTDGEFSVLSVPAGRRSRLTGARLTPSDPPLVAGRGARDGMAMALDALLRPRLDAGDSFG